MSRTDRNIVEDEWADEVNDYFEDQQSGKAERQSDRADQDQDSAERLLDNPEKGEQLKAEQEAVGEEATEATVEGASPAEQKELGIIVAGDSGAEPDKAADRAARQSRRQRKSARNRIASGLKGRQLLARSAKGARGKLWKQRVGYQAESTSAEAQTNQPGGDLKQYEYPVSVASGETTAENRPASRTAIPVQVEQVAETRSDHRLNKGVGQLSAADQADKDRPVGRHFRLENATDHQLSSADQVDQGLPAGRHFRLEDAIDDQLRSSLVANAAEHLAEQERLSDLSSPGRGKR